MEIISEQKACSVVGVNQEDECTATDETKDTFN